MPGDLEYPEHVALPSQAGREGLGGPLSSQSCSPVHPSPLHHPQIGDRRKEQFLSAIY